jgi:hypothetical protein
MAFLFGEGFFMKKIWWVGLGLILIIGGVGYSNWPKLSITQNDLNQSTTATQAAELAGMLLDFGDRQASYSALISEDTSVLSLLTQLENQGHQIETRHYDFGDLVEGIDGFQNGTDKAWIYFVNGKSGEVGAGDKQVMGGDLVEWKYIKPIY